MEGFTVERILQFVLALIAFFTAMTFHEYAHARVAYRLGDLTAKYAGRLTLNPLAHIDIMGTVILPVALAFLNLPVIGWAKPVPINPFYFRRPYQGMMLVAIAGPITNIILAAIGTGLWRGLVAFYPSLGHATSLSASVLANSLGAIAFLLGTFIVINVILAVFNLIPIPPLDGSRVLTYFLPDSGKELMHTIERLQVGFLLIVGLLWLGALDVIIGPIFFWAQKFLLGL